MSEFTDKIRQFSSRGNWQVEILNESSCNIQFLSSNEPFNDALTYIRVLDINSSIQFMLIPNAYRVSDMSKFSHVLSNMLLHRNSESKGVWSIVEMKTIMGSKHVPSYFRVIAEKHLDANAFSEIMDDITSEFKHLH